VNTPYTQLFLTHIDENGNDSPPVLLERFTSPDRAANIPEFVRLPGDAIADIREEFLDAYSFLRAGMANERTGDHKGAERLYRRGLTIEPNNVDILNSLGWTLFQDGRSAEAVAELRHALKLDADYIKAHNNIALALVELGQLDEAAAHWKKSLELEPQPEIYSDYGFTMARLGRPQDALAAYEKALELDPNCASAHFNLGVVSIQAGKFDEAESHYRAALRARPNAETYNGLGFVLVAQGRFDEAVDQFKKAIEVNPEYAPAYNNLAETLAKQGKLDDAAFYYDASLKQRPSASVHTELGIVLRKLGRREDAAEEFRAALALDPGQQKARRNLNALTGKR
jgi:tetratricopeptide (TPR) repeat protein